MRAVSLDGADADPERLRYLLRGLSLADEAEDLLLAFRKGTVAVRYLAQAGAAQVVSHQLRGERRVEEDVALMRRPDRLQELRWVGALQHVAGGTRCDHLEEVLVIVMYCQGDDLHVRPSSLDLAGGLQAIYAVHLDIHEHNVRFLLRHQHQ